MTVQLRFVYIQLYIPHIYIGTLFTVLKYYQHKYQKLGYIKITELELFHQQNL